MAYVKSGWLQRQSTILRRWKRNWFDLWSDGRLVFYNDQHRRDMEDQIHMRVDCINIRSGTMCRDLTPPEGKGQGTLIQVVCRDSRTVSVSADCGDDALAWLMALQDARVSTVISPPADAYPAQSVATAPPPYSEYVPAAQVYEYNPPPPQIVYTADGQPYAVAYPYQYQGAYPPREVHQVIVHEDRRDHAGDMALGILAGAATGMALGSLFVF